MPRKTIRRILPDFAKVLKHPSLRWTKPLIRDPNLLHLNRESVSLAVFIGILSAFIPLPGQTFIAVGLALWWHANLPISVLTIWISNPLTIGPMFYLTHRFGSFLLGSDPIDFTVSLTWEWFFQYRRANPTAINDRQHSMRFGISNLRLLFHKLSMALESYPQLGKAQKCPSSTQ